MNTQLLRAAFEEKHLNKNTGVSEVGRALLAERLEEKLAKKKKSEDTKAAIKKLTSYTSVIPEEYKGVLAAEDFAEKSAFNAGEKNNTYKKINGKSDLPGFFDLDMKGELEHLTDEEKGVYNYLYNTGNTEGAKDFLSKIRTPLSERLAREQYEDYQKRSDEGFFGKVGLSLESLYHQLLSGGEGIGNAARGIAGLFGADTDMIENPYHTTMAQLQRAAVGKDWNGAGNFVYQTAMSGADMLAAMLPGAAAGKALGLTGKAAAALTSGITQGIMSSTAASSAISEAKSRGYGDGEATFIGLSAGVIEWITEKFSIDALIDTKTIKKGAKSYFGYIGKNAGVEALEEAAAELGNYFADAIVTGIGGSEGKLAKAYLKYRDEGHNKGGAICLTALEVFGDTVLAALGGAMMGAGMGAGGAITTRYARGRQSALTGKNISELANSQDLLLAAAEASGDKTLVKGIKSAAEAKNGGKAGYSALGKLALGVEELAEERSGGLISKEREGVKLTEEENSKLEEFYATEFGQRYHEYSVQSMNAAEKVAAREDRVREILTSEERVSAEERYSSELKEAYDAGKPKYKGVEEAYDLYFALAKNLGERSEGRSLSEMMKTLDKKDYKGILSLDNATAAAAFNAGVEYAEGVKKRQSRIDDVVKSEKERLEKEKASEKSEDGKEEASEEGAENGAEENEGEQESAAAADELANFHIDSNVDKDNLTATQKKHLEDIKSIARLVDGLNFVIINDKTSGDNAKYDPKTRTVYVDIDAGRKGFYEAFDYALIEGCTHELAHHLKETAPAKFEELRQFIKSEIFTAQSYEAAVKARYELYKKKQKDFTYADAEEEVIANSLENIFTKQSAMDKLAKKHRSLFSRIWQLVKKFFDKIFGKEDFKVGLFSSKTFESDIVRRASRHKQKQLEDMFVSALRTANENAGALRRAGVESSGAVKHSLATEERKPITADMTEEERYEALKNRKITAPFYGGEADALIAEKKEALESKKIDFAKDAVLDIAEKLGIIRSEINFKDLEVQIVLSNSNLRESVTKEATPTQIVKLLPILASTAENSVVIERHDNRYYHDTDTVYFDNLLGAYIDGGALVPVRFGLKHSRTGATTLYVVVDENKVPLVNLAERKKDRGLQDASPDLTGVSSLRRPVTYSISQIVPFVNSKDLLRYLPDGMLNENQRTAKWEAIAETIKYTNKKNDEKYAKCIARGDERTAKQMVAAAAKRAGYVEKLYHGTQKFGFTEFDPAFSDDKISIFVAGTEELAQTYSGKKGNKKLSELQDFSNLSIAEIVRRLAQETRGTYDGEELNIEYKIMYQSDVNSLINETNDGVENLQKTVEAKLAELAEKDGALYTNEDAKAQQQLNMLNAILQKYQYEHMSTPMYMLLHYTNVFNENAGEIAELEYKIRLMNKLVSNDTSEGVVVKKMLGGYDVSILTFDEAREELKSRLSEGNYALYGKPGNQLVVDCKGKNWNNLSGWAKAAYYKTETTTAEKRGEYYRLYKKSTGEEIFHGRVAITENNKNLSMDVIHPVMVNKANNNIAIRSEYMRTTRDVARFAKENGYDSVKFENIVDNGGMGKSTGAGDVYVYFNPADLKSADPVTYDDKGNIIPLSERFNSAKRDIRYSLSDTLDREVLTESFFKLAETEAERDIIRAYREEIDTVGVLIDERNTLARRFKELEGKKGYVNERTKINAKIRVINAAIERRDKKLLDIRAAKPLKDVIERAERSALAARYEVDPSKITMSRGYMLKEFARHTHERVYTKSDARKILNNIPGGAEIRGRKRELLMEELWQGYNKCADEREEQDFIIGMSNKILDSIIESAQVENPDYERCAELVGYIKDYVGRLTFSEDIKEEIRHKYDVAGSKSFFGRWGNKRTDREPVPVDVFVTEFARENPYYDYLQYMHPADALFEINGIYDEAVKAPVYLSAYDYASAEELTEMKSQIVDELLRAFREGGEESIPARELTKARRAAEKSRADTDEAKRKFKERYRETESFYKATLALDRIARSIRDKKLGTFENATEIQGPALVGLLRDLSRFEYRKTFSPSEVRAKVRELLEWYSTDNPMLAYESVSETGEYIRAIRGMLEDIALRDGEFTAAELYELGDVLTYFVHFAENYNKVFYEGKWVDAVPLAEKYIERMKIAKKFGKNDTNRWSFIREVRKYFDNYSDPLSIVRRYDAYQEDGFYTEMFRMLEKSAVGIATSEARVLGEYYAFLSENPDYLKDAQTEFVLIHGHKVPKLQAIALYMTIRQEHAQAGFVYNGFEYTNFAGEGIKVQDEAERATIEFMRVLRAKSIAKSEGISEDEAYGKTEEPENLTNAEKNYLEPEEIKQIAEAMRANIAKSFTENDKKLIGIVERALSGELREMKYDTDMRRLGFSNIFKGYYFPIMRSGQAKSVEAQSFKDELVSVSNISANKERIKGAKQTLLIGDVTRILTRHARAICTYANMQETVDFYDKIFNVDTSGNKNRAVNLKAASEEVWGTRRNAKGKVVERSAHDYFKELIEDIQGLRSTKDGFINDIIAPIRSGMVVSALGLNAKVLFSQFSSYGAAMHILDFSALARGFGKVVKQTKLGVDVLTEEGRAALKEFGEAVDKYCPLAKVRAEDNHAYLAQGVIEKKDGSVKTSKAAEVLAKGQEKIMAPIGWVDRAVVCSLFEACRLQIERDGGAVYGTEENNVAAGKLLERVILDTQQNSLATEKSRAMRSESEIEKSLTMFSADAMKTFGRFLDAWGEIIVLRKRLAHENNSAERGKLEAALKAAGKKAVKSTTVLLSNAVFMAAVTLLFRFLRGKIKDDEKIWATMLSDFSGNLIGGLPLARDIYSLVVDGYEMSYYAFDTLNTFFQSGRSFVKVVYKCVSGEAQISDLMGALRKIAFAATQVLGIPLRNLWNAIYGIIKLISKDAAKSVDAFFGS